MPIWSLMAEVQAPTPSPSPTFDPNVITPGPLGFVAIAIVTLATLALGIDMMRRVRRVRYRQEVRQDIERELADKTAVRPQAASSGDAGSQEKSQPTGEDGGQGASRD